MGGSTGGGGVRGGGGRGYVCQYLLSHAMAIRVDSRRRRRRGEGESRVCAIPFVSDLCLLLDAASVFCSLCSAGLIGMKGEGEISRTGKITTTTRKRKSETTTNDRRRNKEIKKERKKKGRKEMREWLERNGTEPE